jgi:hypothetical protein
MGILVVAEVLRLSRTQQTLFLFLVCAGYHFVPAWRSKVDFADLISHFIYFIYLNPGSVRNDYPNMTGIVFLRHNRIHKDS